jgi:hypothetical protein
MSGLDGLGWPQDHKQNPQSKPDHGLDYGTLMATEGGRKCPLCGKYAKREEIGNLSFETEFGQGWAHVSMYGHLPGYGCNSAESKL